MPKRTGDKRPRSTKRRKSPTPSASTDIANDSSRVWYEFASKHAGHPCLAEDSIYALPQELIDAIKDKIKDFFTADEEQFERDLSQTAGTGFFLRKPFGYPPSAKLTAEAEQTDELTLLANEATTNIRDMLADDLKTRGFSQQQIEKYFDDEKELNQRIEERQWGYAGWLVTSTEFHRRRDEFRQRWEGIIKEQGRFPRLPISLTGDTPPDMVAPQDREFYSDYNRFYCEWGIDRMATWELPVPMRAELGTPSLYPFSQISGAGIVLFAPWHLLRDREIKIYDLVEHKWMLDGPRHLKPWVTGKPKKWGPDRFSVMLRLYIYLELCIRRRYASRLRGKTEKLDYAFGRFFCNKFNQEGAVERTAESVRKIRQQMRKRLKSS